MLGLNFSTFECWGDINIPFTAPCVQSPVGKQETIPRFHVAKVPLLFKNVERGCVNAKLGEQ